MKALLEKGADRQRAPEQEGLVLGYNIDLSGVDEIGATPFWRAAYASDVAAMRAAGRARRRPEHPDDASGRPPALGDVAGARSAGRLGLRADSGRRPGRAAAAGRRRASATARASPRTRIATRRPAFCRHQVPRRGARRRRQRRRLRRQHRRTPRRRARRQREHPVSRLEGRRRHRGQSRRADDGRHGERPGAARPTVPRHVALLEKLGAKNNNKCVSC